MNSAAPETHFGFVAIIGAPNAGKSTLVNALVGAKISIVTPKVQTTRMRVRGIAIVDRCQIAFVDTPGIFRPRRRLDRAMVDAAWSGADEADAIAVVVDAADYTDEKLGGKNSHSAEDTHTILERISSSRTKKFLVLNKIDGLSRERLLPLAASLNERLTFEQTFMVSSKLGDGVSDFASACARSMPAGPWLFPADQVADLPMRQIAAEIIREKLMLRLHQELPYAITVETEDWQDRPDGSARIEATIYVERDGQKAIVLGEKGHTIKDIGRSARLDLEAQIERRVHLFLHVKVRENWSDDPERYRPLGLDFPKHA